MISRKMWLEEKFLNFHTVTTAIVFMLVGSGRYINATTFFAQVKKCGNSLLAGNGYVNHGQKRNFLFLLLKGLT